MIFVGLKLCLPLLDSKVRDSIREAPTKMSPMMEQLRKIVKIDGAHRLSVPFDRVITVSIVIAIIHLTLETERDLLRHTGFWSMWPL